MPQSLIPNNHKDFHIDVEFLPTVCGGSYAANPGTNHCIVKIDESQVKEENLPEWVVIAHEIGHHLAIRYRLPNAVKEKLHPGSSVFMLEAEREAWNIAEEVLRVRKWALNSYASGIPKYGFWYENLYKLRR